jgi:hypothetical protein
MLRDLPFTTIGDIARHGLELHIYCPGCYSTRRPPAEHLERWSDRCFARARFRCSSMRHTGNPCGAPGVPIVRPVELLQVGGPVTLAFLSCPRCLWEISYVRLDQPPWSGTCQRYRCPGCDSAVDWHFHGPAWRPGGSDLSTARAESVDRPMPNPDPAATLLEKVLGEADALIRRRLEERPLQVPHLVLAVTPEGQVVLRSNVSADVLRAFGKDLIDVADGLEAPPKPGDTRH